MNRLFAGLIIGATLFAPTLHAQPLLAFGGKLRCDLAADLWQASPRDVRGLRGIPVVAYINTARDLVLIVSKTSPPQGANANDLPGQMRTIQDRMSRLYPGAISNTQEIVTLNGRHWGHLDMSVVHSNGSQAQDIFLVTAYQGDELQLQFQAQGALQKTKLVEAFELCARTLKLEE